MKKFFCNIITGEDRSVSAVILRPVLVLLSAMFFIAVKARLFLYNKGIIRSVKLKKPVISIGNITWGGTGKTPLVEAVAGRFLSGDKGLVLLTRGYGSDEDKAVSEAIPALKVLSGKNRLKNALKAQEDADTDIFLLDDGFQHLRIKRDVDIITINAADPFGKGMLIPAGILREPISSLSRADIAIITKSDLADKSRINHIRGIIKRAAEDIDVFEARHEPEFFYAASGEKKPLNYVNKKKICAIAALADNNSFSAALRGLGALISIEHFYTDHYRYNDNDIADITESVSNHNVEAVVTTEKDWVKLKKLIQGDSLNGVELLVLKIGLRIQEDEVFYRRLSSLLSC